MKKNSGKTMGSPIFRRILLLMSILILTQILLLVSSIFGGGVTAHLNQNSKDILKERVINRRNYLENEMVNNWSNLDLPVQQINEAAARLLKEGAVTLDMLDLSSESCEPLLIEISDTLISLLRTNRVTGAFVVFNTHDLESGEPVNKPGLYLRDLDPSSSASFRNMDLLIQRAPASVVQKLGISTDSSWRPRFDFEKLGKYYPFLYEPYQAAYHGYEDGLSYQDFGYWSRGYTLFDDDREVLSYTVPLILQDGTVYGVLGIDLTFDYLRKAIPYSEIFENKLGSYILCVEEEKGFFDNVLVNGPIYALRSDSGDCTALSRTQAGDTVVELGGEDEEFYCNVQYLNLYNTNTPFSGQRWALIGTVRSTDLFSFSHRIRTTLVTSILLTLLVGALGSFLIGRIVSRPIHSLSKSLDSMKPGKTVELGRTGILEVDQLASSIEALSREVIESANKFTQIIEMASVHIAGFEYNYVEKNLFITEGFFDVFGFSSVNVSGMGTQEFERRMKEISAFLVEREDKGQVLYRIPTKEGTVYVRIKYVDDGTRCTGLAEDVTQAVLEKDRIEHERDYDLLTGLINRRAFYRIMKHLFDETPYKLRTAAVVMMDLDNLKNLNDSYGHDCGDKYIRSAAECFLEAVPRGTVVSRISGDEFYIFYYGYDSKEEIRRLLSRLKKAISEKKILLPTQEECHIRASGGVAWYPDDSTSFEELLKFSDFAMYKTKQLVKGELSDFDLGVYSLESFLLQNKAELTELLEKGLVQYYFQPIVSARTGEVFAYEALMRVDMPTLHSPDEVITLARLESKLHQIEELTWFKAMETYVHHLKAGRIPLGCKVFINSVSNQALTEEQVDRLEELYSPYLHNVVLEATEDEQSDEPTLRCKRQAMTRWGGALALDDYGSGYNSEKALLALSPEYIKIDLSIIRGIDQSPDKQKIVQNIISYAHERKMFLVAEGIETEAEARAVIGMGVDYLQGYLLSKPAPAPPAVPAKVREFLLSLSRGQDVHGG